MQAARLWIQGRCQTDMQHNIPSLFEESNNNNIKNENMKNDDQIIDNTGIFGSNRLTWGDTGYEFSLLL